MKVQYKGWGEVTPQAVHRFVALQQALTEEKMQELAAEWEKVQTENMPLRVVQDGKLQSVPIDYYDSIIEEELAKTPEEFAEASLIGSTVARISVSDSFVALRIEEWIRRKRFTVFKEEIPGSRSYRRWLKKEMK